MSSRRMLALGLGAVAAVALASPLVVWAKVTAPAAPGIGEEPPLELVLTAGGERYEVYDGQPFTLTIGGREVEATIAVAPSRTLVTPELSFRYPTTHSFEFDDSAGSDQWTLDGSSTTIILTRFEGQTQPDDVVKLLVKSLGDEFERVTELDEPTLTLAGTAHRGRAIDGTVMDTTIRTSIFAVAVGKNTYALMLQDVVDGPNATAEYDAMKKLLEESWTVGQ